MFAFGVGVRLITFLLAQAAVESFTPPPGISRFRRSTPCAIHHETYGDHSCAFHPSTNLSKRVHIEPNARYRTTSLAMTSPSTGAVASILSSLHANNSFVLSALLVLSACGIAMEQKTTFGKALSVSATEFIHSVDNFGFEILISHV